jgi:hypothetical protein
LEKEVSLMGLSPVSSMSGGNIFPSRETGLNRSDTLCSGNWFENRSIESQHLRRFLPTRASISWVPPAPGEKAPSVISTCPVTLRDFYLRDADGDYWQAAEVPPGSTIMLRRLAGAAGVSSRNQDPEVLPAGLYLAVQTIGEMKPMSFFARASSWDEAVPIPTLDSIDWEDHIIVMGPVRASYDEGGAEQ